MSELTEKIRSRGYWDIVIRPQDFDEHRIPYENLESTIGRAKVRFRGWPVPFIGGRNPMLRGKDWIGEDIDAEVVSHYEAWRFWTSGQFAQLRCVSADWRKGKEATTVPPNYSGVIEVWEILFYLTEVFELAARLALGPAGSDAMVITASLYGLANRALIVGQSNRGEFMEPCRSTIEEQTYEVTLMRDVLVAQPREEGAKMAREFFMRFGWQPSLDQLLAHQCELTEYLL